MVIENGLQPVMETAVVDDASPLPITEALDHSFDWTIPIAIILLTGTLIRLLYLSQGYSKLKWLIRSGEKHFLPSGAKVCVVDAPFAPFSWMQTIVLSRVDWKTGPSTILAHEEAHVRHRHSYDVMVVEMLTALQCSIDGLHRQKRQVPRSSNRKGSTRPCDREVCGREGRQPEQR